MLNSNGASAGMRPLPRTSIAANRLRDSSWSSVSTGLLRAELARRADTSPRPECGSGHKGSYHTGWHVFALVLILVLSTVGAFPPFLQLLDRANA